VEHEAPSFALESPPTGGLCQSCKLRWVRRHPLGGYYRTCATCARRHRKVYANRRQGPRTARADRRRQAGYRAELRAAVLAALGGACACAGCPTHSGACPVGRRPDTDRLLTVEHTRNNGAEHRRRLRDGGPRTHLSAGFWGRYLRVIRHDPDHGMILLCRNCHAEAERRKRLHP
jgi:hypothetical protein